MEVKKEEKMEEKKEEVGIKLVGVGQKGKGEDLLGGFSGGLDVLQTVEDIKIEEPVFGKIEPIKKVVDSPEANEKNIFEENEEAYIPQIGNELDFFSQKPIVQVIKWVEW